MLRPSPRHYIYIYSLYDPLLAIVQLNASETADHVVMLTRAIAEYPYRMNPSALACVTKVKVPGAAKIDADGERVKTKSTTETWIAQLQMIPGVSFAIAQAIAARYPTLRTLLDAYADPCRSAKEKALLLAVRREMNT